MPRHVVSTDDGTVHWKLEQWADGVHLVASNADTDSTVATIRGDRIVLLENVDEELGMALDDDGHVIVEKE